MAGPFYFAWADAAEMDFGPEHVRADEHVFSFTIQHDEGDFPVLDIAIMNPRVGLLAPGRKLWAWLSYDKAWTPPAPVQEGDSESEESESDTSDVVPLFFGRLVGVPADLDQELIQLSFVARPEDYQEQKVAIADTLKARPYWDPIWFAPESLGDPDNVLESRPELWHVDRTTLLVTTSHILSGEDGTIELGEADVFYDSVRVSYGQAPVRRAEVTAQVSWDQNASGIFDLSRMVQFGGPFLVNSFTGEGLVANWPKPGTGLGGGWSVAFSTAVRVDGTEPPTWGWVFTGNIGFIPGTIPVQNTFTRAHGAHGVQCPIAAPPFSIAAGLTRFNKMMLVYEWQIHVTLGVQYDVSRKRDEVLTFALEADVQSVLTEPGDEEVLQIGLSSSEVASPIDPGGLLPIGTVRRPSYFSMPRGAQSIEYLIALARSRLLARARMVDIEMELPGTAAVELELSCRKSCVFTDSRLPGGEAAGKIKSYSITMDGDSGAFLGSVTVGCSVGQGGTVSATDGTPTYCETGYVNTGYQRYVNQMVMPIAGEVTYESQEGLPANDDGIDFLRLSTRDVVLDVQKSGTPAEQRTAMGFTAAEPGIIFERLKTVPTEIKVILRSLGVGPFTTNYNVAVSELKLPKTIDLEAPSSP